ncbi:MAG: hypothetical protein ABIG84_02250 [archaeon]
MKRRHCLLLLLLFVTINTVSGEVVGAERAEQYLESVMILKVLAQVAVIVAAAYCYFMDIPLSLFGDDNGKDLSPKEKIERMSKYLVLICIIVGLIEIIGKFYLAIQGTTVPGA